MLKHDCNAYCDKNWRKLNLEQIKKEASKPLLTGDEFGFESQGSGMT